MAAAGAAGGAAAFAVDAVAAAVGYDIAVATVAVDVRWHLLVGESPPDSVDSSSYHRCHSTICQRFLLEHDLHRR